MALRKREQVLSLAAGSVVVVLAVSFLLSGSGESTATLQAQRDQLTAQLDKENAQVRRATRLQAKLTEWQHRALPTDRAAAQSAYQNWLLGLMESNAMHRVEVKPGDVRSHRDVYDAFPFSVRFQATQEELVRFLYAFYSAGNLDQIRHLSIKPAEDAAHLDVLLSIEALSLPSADRRDKLTAEHGKRLTLADVAEYIKTIAQRQVFTAYAAPTPEKPPAAKPEPSKFDATKFAYLTAVLEVDGRPQVWLRSRTTDETFKLREGEKCTIGASEAKVVRIVGAREVEIEVDGVRHTLVLGANLREGAGQPGAAPAEPKPEQKPDVKPDAAAEAKPGEGPKPEKKE